MTENLWNFLAGFSNELTPSGRRWFRYSPDGAATETILELSYEFMESMTPDQEQQLLEALLLEKPDS